MIEPLDPATVERFARRSPIAAMTTVSELGSPRVRLVHPVWERDGRTGIFLTDERSPKAEDVRACPRITLVYQQRDEQYLLAVANASVEHDEGFVAATIERFEAESGPYGYRPSDFWPDEQLERVVAVRLDLIRIELTTFTNDEMEVKRWARARSSSALEILPG